MDGEDERAMKDLGLTLMDYIEVVQLTKDVLHYRSY